MHSNPRQNVVSSSFSDRAQGWVPHVLNLLKISHFLAGIRSYLPSSQTPETMDAASILSEEEVAEIKKVFSMVDDDGRSWVGAYFAFAVVKHCVRVQDLDPLMPLSLRR